MSDKGTKEIILADILPGRPLPDSGEILGALLLEAIDNDQILKINMAGVSGLPTLFFNTSFGSVIEQRGVAALRGHVRFSNITPAQLKRIKDYIEKFTQVSFPD